MFRVIGKTVVLSVLVVTGSIILYVYSQRSDAERKIAQLQLEKQQLQQMVQRMETDRRVAKILVSKRDQTGGQVKTTLLFVEYARDNTPLPAKQFTIDGEEVHFDAEIVKFKDQFVEADDPLRGRSIILFTRVYGAHQAPADGFPIDAPGSIPEIYRGADPQVPDFEKNIWTDFWKLYNDRDAREAVGIRGLHGEGLYGMFEPGHVYTITLRADGDGTINEEPLEPIYSDALHQDTPQKPAPPAQ